MALLPNEILQARKNGCKGCVWWDIENRSGKGVQNPLNLSRARCQVFPPTYGSIDSFFPETYGGDFCSAWTPYPEE